MHLIYATKDQSTAMRGYQTKVRNLTERQIRALLHNLKGLEFLNDKSLQAIA
jgi:hypothetical protein